MKKRAGDGWSFQPAHEPQPPRTIHSLPPADQRAVITTERRARGKVVTVVSALVLTAPDLKQLGKTLKAACGTGGTARDGAIELQGDCRDRVRTWLDQNGWGVRG